MKLYRLSAALFLLAFFTQGLAHIDHLEVSGQRVVLTDAGAFLEMQVQNNHLVSYDPLRLRVVGVGSAFAQLEARSGEAYQAVESIPISHELVEFGATTPYRVRLPGTYRQGEKLTLTLLFGGDGGGLASLPAYVERPPRRWLWAALPLGVIAAAVLLRLRGYQLPRQHGTAHHDA